MYSSYNSYELFPISQIWQNITRIYNPLVGFMIYKIKLCPFLSKIAKDKITQDNYEYLNFIIDV